MNDELSQNCKISPMMLQWHECKNKAKNAILLFRLGDFYEAFHEDAILLSKELELTLTKRQEIPMAGIPYHTSESYIDKLVSKGFRVAIAEQMEDPKTTKGLVKRELTRIVTPGTVITSSLLNDKTNNFFMSIYCVQDKFGIAICDLTTSEFWVVELTNASELATEIYRLKPAELLVNKLFLQKYEFLIEDLKHSYNFLVNEHDEWRFEKQTTYTFLINHLKVLTLDGFGIKDKFLAISSGGALLQYLQDDLCLNISHIQEVKTYSTSSYMILDPITQRNLELTESIHEGNKRNTLLSILDETKTPMGARLLRQWVKQPLINQELIAGRQDGIEFFLNNYKILDSLRNLLEAIKDIERLIMRILAGHGNPRDVVSLRYSLEVIPQIKNLFQLNIISSEVLKEAIEEITALPELTNFIQKAILEEPAIKLSEGNIIKSGFHPELDELRLLSTDSKTWLSNYQQSIRESTGIKTLKVSYNRMFGYYIEVSKGQSDRMPSSFERKQTLVNAERFISPELKEYEVKILSAEEKINQIEAELFQLVRQEVSKYSSLIVKSSQNLALLDTLQSLSFIARKNDYCRPTLNDLGNIYIKEGRHPVIESVSFKEKFIPNDTYLNEKERLYLITGPNMAGKSTYLRQVALIAIMAQIGSYVPATSAEISIIDRVFTRIGASDDLSRGQSTFMVEMVETANILNNATDRSLVILDEIGRGTSTYDGISIAWAVAEHLLTSEGQQAKTLFATHYWELTKLENKIPGAVNYRVAVQESEDAIIFLRKILRGETDKSHGILVGKLAGLPQTVIERAKEILKHLEEIANRKAVFEPKESKVQPRKKPKSHVNPLQLTFF